MISAFTARAPNRCLFRIEICLLANSPCQYVSKALISTQKNMVSHWSIPMVSRYCTANPHAPFKMAMRTRVMCAVIGQCAKQSLYATNPVACIFTAQSWLARNVIRTAILDRAMEHRTPWMDQGRVCLSTEPAFCAFSTTLCGMSHSLDQHRLLVSVL